MEAGPNKEKPEFDEMKMKKRVNHQKRIKEHFDPMSRTLTREERDRNLVKYLETNYKLILNSKRKRSILLHLLEYTLQKTISYHRKTFTISCKYNKLIYCSKTLVLFQYPDRHKLLSSSPKAKRDLSPKEEDRIIEEMTKPVPEKPRLKVKGYYSLDREVSRYMQH